MNTRQKKKESLIREWVIVAVFALVVLFFALLKEVKKFYTSRVTVQMTKELSTTKLFFSYFFL